MNTVRRLVNNDYSFGQDRNCFISGLSGLLQQCRTRLQQLNGEWFLKHEDGVAWFDVIGQTINYNLLNKKIEQCVMSIIGVERIAEITSIFDEKTRQVAVYLKIKTIYGDADLNEQINLEVL
ncbi:hypothetical protein [Acinetobacter higginsii]|uniref:hypothetical protein n=1 Tax=Acinetobacter higginsii TaxID=70347 RepID=UPI001F600195|nr:hypothetical protein [Acinetobacter higginsii]MCI3877558.1 hypothetical protein [Acinetobacter higginsii]